MSRHVAGAEPADFLLYGARHVHIAGGAFPGRDEPADAVHLRRQRALDVDRAPTPQDAVVHFGAVGVMRPVRRIPGVDVVEVGVEHHGGGLPHAAEEADDVPRLVVFHFVIAERAHLGSHEHRHLPLLPGHRLRTHEALEEADAGVHAGGGEVNGGVFVRHDHGPWVDGFCRPGAVAMQRSP